MDELCRRNLVNVLVTDGEEVLTRTPRVLGHSGRIVHTAHSNWCDNIPESTPGTLHFLMLLGKAKERIYLLLRNIHDLSRFWNVNSPFFLRSAWPAQQTPLLSRVPCSTPPPAESSFSFYGTHPLRTWTWRPYYAYWPKEDYGLKQVKAVFGEYRRMMSNIRGWVTYAFGGWFGRRLSSA